MVLLMVALVTAAVFGVILYRISMVAALSVVDQVNSDKMYFYWINKNKILLTGRKY